MRRLESTSRNQDPVFPYNQPVWRTCMTAVSRLITTLMLLLAATALIAQEAPVPRTTEPLTDAINTAMKQNLGVQLQNYETRISGYNLRGQYGLYDWISAGDVGISSDRNATTSSIQASSGRSINANASVNQIIPTGGQYSFAFRNGRATT